MHPTELYAALAGFTIFAGLLWIDARSRRAGTTVFALVAAMGAQRFVIEAFRWNETLEMTALGWSVYQVVAASLFGLGAVGLIWIRTRPAVDSPVPSGPTGSR